MNIRTLFKRKNPKPKERVLYAITNGTYMGACVIFIKPNEYPKNGIYAVMAIGDKDFDGGMNAMEIPAKDVTEGLSGKILDKIRRVPPELYSLCCTEYEARMKLKTENISNESTN